MSYEISLRNGRLPNPVGSEGCINDSAVPPANSVVYRATPDGELAAAVGQSKAVRANRAAVAAATVGAQGRQLRNHPALLRAGVALAPDFEKRQQAATAFRDQLRVAAGNGAIESWSLGNGDYSFAPLIGELVAARKSFHQL